MKKPDLPASVKAQFDLTGKVAVITGGAGFLGVQFAEAVVEMGGTAVLFDLKQDAIDTAIARVDQVAAGRCHGQVVDIASADSIRAAVAATLGRFDRIDILVNSAGLTKAGMEHLGDSFFAPFESYPLELWDAGLRINLTGAMLMCQAVGPHMVARGHGSIINIASDLAVIAPDHRIYKPDEHGYPGVSFNSPAFYPVSKAGLVSLTKYLATLWAEQGVRVNAVSPAGVWRGHDEGFVKKLSACIPMNRMAVENEFKGAIIWLASDASSFVTGTNVMIDGGRTTW